MQVVVSVVCQLFHDDMVTWHDSDTKSPGHTKLSLNMAYDISN